MLRFTEVIIYHQIQAKIFFVKSRDSKFCGKFWLWFHSNNLPLNLGNFRLWCYFCPDWMVNIGFNFSVRIYHSKWAITFSLQISWNFDCKFSMVKSCFNSYLVVIYHPIQAKIFFVKSRNSKSSGKFWQLFNSNNLPWNLANFQFWCFSVPKLDG